MRRGHMRILKTSTSSFTVEPAGYLGDEMRYPEDFLNKIICGDCLEVMKGISDESIDMILCDLPYGTTKCKWDIIIPFEPLWEQYKRIIKERGVIVLAACQPFTSMLVMSNMRMFKYEWIWNKVTARGHLVAKKRPMAQHENVLVFYKHAPTYNPQMVKRDKPIKGTEGRRTDIMGGSSTGFSKIYTHSYPKTIQVFSMDRNLGHPTQKPVALFEYLIKTYSNEGDIVLDNCAGSGTTGMACRNLNRNFILVEKEEKYCRIARDRLEKI